MPDTLQKEKRKVFTFHLKNYIEKKLFIAWGTFY